MQFYENYVRLCNLAGKKPTAVAAEVGISRATASRWSRGMVPTYSNLLKIAEYFDVTVGELVGATPDNAKDLAKYFGVAESLLSVAEAVQTGKAESSEGAAEELLQVLRTSPGRRMLLAATKNMSEEQVRKMAEFAQAFRGDDD